MSDVAHAYDTEEQLAVLQRLEEHFLAHLTTKVGDFMRRETAGVQLVPLHEEQPLANHAAYDRYCKMMEAELVEHLRGEGRTSADLVELCRPLFEEGRGGVGGEEEEDARARQSAFRGSLVSVEYIAAMSEYAGFMQLAADHLACQEWCGGEALEGGGGVCLEEDEEEEG